MTLKTIINTYQEYIKSCDINKAFAISEGLGSLLWKNNIGVVSTPEVENILYQRIFKALSFERYDAGHNNQTVFVATEIYESGGHTRLLENLANYLNHEVDLLITKKASQSILLKERNYFSNIKLLGRSGKNAMESISEIVKALSCYKNIVLNTHPNDIITIVSCKILKSLNKNVRIFFVNHADHVFNFGSSVADIWFEISAYGIKLDSERQLSANKSYLGIPIKLSSVESSIEKFENGDLMLTAASMYKFKPIDGYKIMPLIDRLLTEYPDSKCQVIGVKLSKNYWWWPLKLKYLTRLVLSPSLPYDEYMAVTRNAKLYIDSQPLTGGTAFAEQFLNGKNCIGLKGYIWGYTPLDSVKNDDIDSIVNSLKQESSTLTQNVREKVIEAHSPELIKERFLSALEGNFTHHDVVFTNKDVDEIKIRTVRTIKNIPNDFVIINNEVLFELFKHSSIKTFSKCLLRYLFS